VAIETVISFFVPDRKENLAVHTYLAFCGDAYAVIMEATYWEVIDGLSRPLGQALRASFRNVEQSIS
jgi:hypothetical protein